MSWVKSKKGGHEISAEIRAPRLNELTSFWIIGEGVKVLNGWHDVYPLWLVVTGTFLIGKPIGKPIGKWWFHRIE